MTPKPKIGDIYVHKGDGKNYFIVSKTVKESGAVTFRLKTEGSLAIMICSPLQLAYMFRKHTYIINVQSKYRF